MQKLSWVILIASVGLYLLIYTDNALDFVLLNGTSSIGIILPVLVWITKSIKALPSDW